MRLPTTFCDNTPFVYYLNRRTDSDTLWFMNDRTSYVMYISSTWASLLLISFSMTVSLWSTQIEHMFPSRLTQEWWCRNHLWLRTILDQTKMWWIFVCTLYLLMHHCHKRWWVVDLIHGFHFPSSTFYTALSQFFPLLYGRKWGHQESNQFWCVPFGDEIDKINLGCVNRENISI